MKIISLNFDNNPEANKLITSCNKYGYDLMFVGEGHRFTDFRSAKIDLLLDEIKKIDDDIIAYTDGLDSFFLNESLEDKYRYIYGNHIVVSGNKDLYPASELYTKESFKNYGRKSEFKYICSSQFIGYKNDLIKLFELMKNVYKGYVDQEAWNYIYCESLYPIMIDFDCELFLNMTLVEKDEFYRIINTSNPCSVHFGGGKGGSPNDILMKDIYKEYYD